MDTQIAAPSMWRAEASAKGWRSSALERFATLVEYDMDDTIYHAEEQAECWYRVVAGAARKCVLTAHGGRQIVDFLLPGDVFGFGAHFVHHCSAEVITPGTILCRYSRARLERLAESDRQVSRCIWQMAFESIERLQARTLILGRTSALARVSAFLLEWGRRCRAQPQTAISLPMSRYDIADYLAIAVETVSRAFTALRTRQVITFCSTRRLSICDPQALALMAEGTDEEAATADLQWVPAIEVSQRGVRGESASGSGARESQGTGRQAQSTERQARGAQSNSAQGGGRTTQ